MFKKLLLALVMVGLVMSGTALATGNPQFLSFYGPNSGCFMTMQNYYANNTLPKWICSAEEPVLVAGKFVVYFDFDSAKIKADQVPALEKALAHIKAMNSHSITLVAFCDFRGPDSYNNKLGERRLKSVETWLLEHGAPDSFVLVNNGRSASPIRKLANKFCKKCWEDRKVEIGVE
jgi:outer membrane protein OmpA-like peptidoglycan-associated protein